MEIQQNYNRTMAMQFVRIVTFALIRHVYHIVILVTLHNLYLQRVKKTAHGLLLFCHVKVRMYTKQKKETIPNYHL